MSVPDDIPQVEVPYDESPASVDINTLPTPRAIDPKRPSRYFRKGGGVVPKGCGRIVAKLKDLDADLRAAIADARHREPTLGELFTLQSLLLCEQEILLCQKWMRENQTDHAGCINMAERQRKIAMERDKHFDRLGLGEAIESRVSMFEVLYQQRRA